MTKRKVFFILFLLGAAVFTYWWSRIAPRPNSERTARIAAVGGRPKPDALTQTSSTGKSAESPTAHRKEVISKILGALSTSITFYGKVVDQNGEAVSSADVSYGAIDKFDENGSKYHGESDGNGNFSIRNVRGAVLTVGVSKKGYYNIPGKSYMAFAYGIGPDSTRKAPPTADNPALFTLRKMGRSTPLIRAKTGQIDIPTAGEPIQIDLATGKKGSGFLQVESWCGDENGRHFSWRYRFSVVGGGITERDGPFDFEAPKDNYQSSMEVNMPADLKEWTSDVSKSYFVKMPDGTYARFSINLYVGRGKERNFVVLESYVNPAPGDRDLEYDPNSQIPSP